MGYERVKPGEAVQQLLSAVESNEAALAHNIAISPEHWCCVIALAVPTFALVRTKRACMGWGVADELFAFVPAD